MTSIGMISVKAQAPSATAWPPSRSGRRRWRRANSNPLRRCASHGTRWPQLLGLRQRVSAGKNVAGDRAEEEEASRVDPEGYIESELGMSRSPASADPPTAANAKPMFRRALPSRSSFSGCSVCAITPRVTPARGHRKCAVQQREQQRGNEEELGLGEQREGGKDGCLPRRTSAAASCGRRANPLLP